ncbi:hypothetical protein K3X41_13615 [Aliiroseovarius crassostreae]|uniref:hypothetical protein n=1 Tax=Aliiroseovarius crassostreae TaxID=154981 RepID=UPI002202C14F|nr:hypothetical protein [Aliiroseovarius crassostreae]UWQ10883.1 hypothetical protein K3X41_13615 [Aliiroseovarius crassostreae]
MKGIGVSGLDILKHSWGMVWRNKADAARISVVLLLLSMVVGFALSFSITFSPDLLLALGPIGLVLVQLVQQVLSLLIGAWIAVAWHRYVLMNEDPTGWLPQLRGPQVMTYALWAVLMMIGVVVLSFPLILAFLLMIESIEAGAVPNTGQIVFLIIAFVIVMSFAMIAMMRLSTVLVSRALGERLGVKQAWAATRGSNKMIFALFCWMFLILFVVMLVVGFVASILGSMGLTILAFGVVVPIYVFGGWLFAMLQISIMTTIYGVYVEGRELPYSGGNLA